MTAWYYSSNRGQNLLGSNITVATSSTTGADFELRVNALDANSVAVQKNDVQKFICQLEKFIFSSGLDGGDNTTAKGGTDLPPL